MEFTLLEAMQPSLGFLPFAITPVAAASRIQTMPGSLARCIGCGCTDLQACRAGCWWLACDRLQRIGVCSSCPGALPSWFTRFAHEPPAQEPV